MNLKEMVFSRHMCHLFPSVLRMIDLDEICDRMNNGDSLTFEVRRSWL